MTGAGYLRQRVELQKRDIGYDGFGNEETGEWTTQCVVAAGFKPLRGGESVLAARLDGRQPYIVTVRQSSQTRQVTTDWRMVDARDASRVFNIRAITDPDQSRAFFEMLVEQGVAT